jgi:hypothetical protein
MKKEALFITFKVFVQRSGFTPENTRFNSTLRANKKEAGVGI